MDHELGGQTVLVKAQCDDSLGNALECLQPPIADGCGIVIHGIEVDRAASIEWAYNNFRTPDNFLHIIVRKTAP